MQHGTILLDANLLVLFVVGAVDRSLLGRHKRVQAFLPEDYDLLCRTLANAPAILVTPNVLTEASNLLGQIDGTTARRLRVGFKLIIQKLDERYVPSSEAAERSEFPDLGLTDTAMLSEGLEKAHVLTADWRLCNAALRAGRDATNFNHLRDAHWSA